ncbi:conserved oligomeric Golgi complex subunit 6 [Plakobranchus ocellatus]|uniref:Conserved oligomeric Golgi complex subunit 6 n=1 Tax=Plakobranchus ocellatus TaxID=259542 RepID=A0AAV4B7X3_9GAST|nr:conserved oligomeric Golgi complex subunit 6 [Plakobranchus ocellatus]
MADKEPGDVASAPASNNPLSRKLSKILETRLDNDKDMLEALKALSTFFVENNLRSRRNLRSDIEKRSLGINEDFLTAFQAVKEQLDDVYSDVQAMNECCLDMTNRLKAAKAKTHHLISQTTTLHNERVKQIHSDCKFLLRTNHQTAGLEIMESMALHQESAYERLYRWAQNQCRLVTQDTPDVSPLLCQAMEALQDRPVLLKYSLDEFGKARRSSVVRGFIDALTRGATNIQLDEQLGHITQGVCTPFKVRVEQVLVSEQDPVTLYRLDNLLKFYHHTIGQIVNAEAPLLSVVAEIQDLSHRMFFNSLTSHANKLLDKVELPPPDLGPTDSLTQSLQLLRDVLACHDASVVPIDDKKQDYKQILSCVIDPLLQMCSMSASRLTTVDMAAYMVNCIHLMNTTLALYEFTDTRLEMLNAQTEAHVDTLVSEQASYILNRVGLAQMYGALQTYKSEQVRVEQVLVSEQDPVTLYRLDNLLKFYHHTIGQIVNAEAPLLSVVAEIQDLSHRMFFNSLTSHANKLLDKVELPPPDLGPTDSLTQSLQLLRDVLACHDASVVPIDDKKQDYKQILSCVIDPLLQMCSMSASRLTTVDMAAYMVNCIHLMNTTLALYEFTDTRLEMLNAQTEAHVDTLVSEQASYILNRVGLAQMYGALQTYKSEQGPLSSFPGLDELAVKSAVNKFDSYLAQPDSLTLPQFHLILSSSVRETATKRSTDLICQAYRQVYNAVLDPSHGYKDGPAVVPRTPEQVVHLLS